MPEPPKKLSELTPRLTAPDPADLIYAVRPTLGANGSQGITNNDLFSTITGNIADGALRFAGAATIPPLSAAGQGAIYFDQAQNRFLVSENGGPYQSITRGVGRALPPNVTEVPSVGSGLSNLHSFILDAGTLKTDGDYFNLNMSGQIANNNNPKGFRFTLSGVLVSFVNETALAIIGAPAAGSGGAPCGWKLFAKGVRLSPTTMLIAVSLIFGVSKFDSAGANVGSGSIIVSRNFSGDIGGSLDVNPKQFAAQAYGTADGDVTQNLTTAEIYNF